VDAGLVFSKRSHLPLLLNLIPCCPPLIQKAWLRPLRSSPSRLSERRVKS
jgi:hypothetical protein